MVMKNPIRTLRKLALLEAWSYLILLLVAMPLKYVWGMSMAVRIVGSVHGLLFVLLCCSLLHTQIVTRWPLIRSVQVFIASLIPLAPFFIDRRLRQAEDDFMAKVTA